MIDPNKMVELCEQALQSNVAVKQVTADGTTIVMDRQQALNEYAMWVSLANKVRRKGRSRFRTIDMGSAW